MKDPEDNPYMWMALGENGHLTGKFEMSRWSRFWILLEQVFPVVAFFGGLALLAWLL